MCFKLFFAQFSVRSASRKKKPGGLGQTDNFKKKDDETSISIDAWFWGQVSKPKSPAARIIQAMVKKNPKSKSYEIHIFQVGRMVDLAKWIRFPKHDQLTSWLVIWWILPILAAKRLMLCHLCVNWWVAAASASHVAKAQARLALLQGMQQKS